MSLPLSEQEIQQLRDRLDRLKRDQINNVRASEGLKTKLAQAEKDEAINKKQWDYFNSIIHNYEREIEKISGRFIASPITNADIVRHANSGGRLYQGIESFDPKTISEMVGGGLSSTIKENREEAYLPELEKRAKILETGLGPNSGTSTLLASNFNAGSPDVSTEDALQQGSWYTIAGRVLFKAGTSTLVPGTTTGTETINDSYTTEIVDRIDAPNAEVLVNEGASVAVFNGYSNTERDSLNASSTTQTLFDVLYEYFKQGFNNWSANVAQQQTIIMKNPDPQMDSNYVNELNDLVSFNQSYEMGYPINDASLGILYGVLADRQGELSTRVTEVQEQKKNYYPQRISFSKARANLVAGTLTRTLFVGQLKEDFPDSGDPDVQAQIRSIEDLLAQS